MRKGIFISMIGIAVIGIVYWVSHIIDFDKRTPQDGRKENPNAELNAQIQFPGYPTSEKVEFNIKAERIYRTGESIDIKLVWKNNSDETERIMIKDYQGHPIGIGGSIVDLNNVEQTSYVSTHVLSSQLFTMEDLVDYEIDLYPNEIKQYSVDLLSIPVMKETASGETKSLPKGKYKIQVFYYSRISDIFEIEIK